jgi:hypothetical protein
MKSVQTLVIVATWFAGMRFLLGWVYQAVPRGLVIGFIWMLLVWFAPMLCDVVSQSVLYPDQAYVAGWLFAASPLGALIQIWEGPSTRVVLPGLAIQIGLIFIPWMLFNRRRQPRLLKPLQAA